MLFKKINFTKDSIDPNKPTVIIYDNSSITEYTHIYGTGRLIGEYLSKEQYNVIYISTTSKSNVQNLLVIDKKYMSDNFKGRTNNQDADVHNSAIFNKSMDNLFTDLGISEIDYFIASADIHYQLLLMPFVSKKKNETLHDRMNVFFDYLGNDKNTLDIIEERNSEIVDNFNKYISPVAFMAVNKFIGFNFILYLKKKSMLKHQCIFFSIDPTLYTPFFIKNDIPSTFCYFVEDKRGTRNFTAFDIAQLQHLVYDKKYLPSSLDMFADQEEENSKNLLFYGTIFQEKGPRSNVYYEFLNDFRDPDNLSSLYIPYIKNRPIISEKSNRNGYNKDLDELFGQLYHDVVNHPHTSKDTDILYAVDIPNQLKVYKYTLVIRCVSPEDSLNFRPVLSVLYNTLPFFDYRYDPDNLQIPKEFNDALVVKDANDLMKKIEYFNKHENERTRIIQSLRTHFRIDYYLENPDRAAQEEIKKIIPDFKIITK